MGGDKILVDPFVDIFINSDWNLILQSTELTTN